MLQSVTTSTTYLTAVDVDERLAMRDEADDAICVLEDAMLAQNVRAAQLDVLRLLGFGRAHARYT